MEQTGGDSSATLVPGAGIEPARDFTSQVFETCVFASFTTQAYVYYLTARLNLLRLARMLPFFSTFISGLGKVTDRWLKEDLADVEVDFLLDGLVVFRTKTPSHQVGKIRFFNNSFILISRDKPIGVDGDKAVQVLLADKDLGEKLSSLGAVKGGSFKLVVSFENRTVSVDHDSSAKLERFISNRTGLKWLGVEGEREFWVMVRSDGSIFFGLRITSLKKKVTEGELKLGLANVLCRLSDPLKSDIFLDPYCGSGAIFLERISSFPYKFACAIDSDVSKINLLTKKVSWTREKVKIRAGNALNLSEIEDESVDKIVTDPPWGHHEKLGDVGTFYKRMIDEFGRVLGPGGVMVVLVAREIGFEGIALTTSKFTLAEKYEILVSGKKASIFKFLRA